MHKVFKVTHHMALVGLWHMKEELAKAFEVFQINFSKHLRIKSKDQIIKPYHTHQLLR
jgi:hypothetical protein